MITGRGVGILIVAIFVFVLVGVTRVGWLLLFDSVLWGVALVSAAMPWLAMGKLSVTRRVTSWEGNQELPGPTEGSPVRYEVTVRNEGRLPSAFSTLDFALGGEPPERSWHRLFVAWLGRSKDLSFQTDSIYDRRGLHQLEPVVHRNSVPFGLFRRTKRIEDETSVLILPRVYPVSDIHSLGFVGEEDQDPRPARVGDQSIGSRMYFPGDPWQHIHWRNTARLHDPQVKEYESSPERAVTIVFDASSRFARDDHRQEQFEDAVRVAASLGVAAVKAGIRVRVIAGDLDMSTGDTADLLEALAVIQPSGAMDFGICLQRASFESVAAIVPADDPQSIGQLRNFAAARGSVSAFVLTGYEGSDAEIGIQDVGVTATYCETGNLGESLAGGASRTPVEAVAST